MILPHLAEICPDPARSVTAVVLPVLVTYAQIRSCSRNCTLAVLFRDYLLIEKSASREIMNDWKQTDRQRAIFVSLALRVCAANRKINGLSTSKRRLIYLIFIFKGFQMGLLTLQAHVTLSLQPPNPQAQQQPWGRLTRTTVN